MQIGFILIPLMTVFIIILLGINHKIRIVTTNYYFYMANSIVFLIYFCIVRWFKDIGRWIDWLQGENFSINRSVIISKAFLLDLCPFIALAFPISLIADKTRNLAKILALFGIVGPGVTLYGQILFQWTDAPWEYIFGNQLYFSMHCWVFIFSFLVLQNSTNFSWKEFIGAHIFIIIYFSYVLIFVYGFSVNQNVTGLAEHDWSASGQYHTVSKIFNLDFPWAPIICFSLVWLWVVLMMFGKNALTFNQENMHEKEISVQKFLSKIFKQN